MQTQQTTVSGVQSSALSTHTVLRNTYFLLSLTLLFSAGTAYFAMSINAQPLGIITLLLGMFGFYFLTVKTRNSGWGLLSIFLYTGFMGYVLGPILNMYLQAYTNGSALIATSFGATAVIFLALSAFVLISKKDFSYMGGFLAITAIVAFMAGIASVIFHMPMLNLMVSGAFALIASGYILFTTSSIINGGERNYIMATITLYVAIFNLFLSLLRILSFFAGNRN